MSLLRAMDRYGICEEALAAACGLHQSAVNRIKNGRHVPRLSTAWCVVHGLRELTGEPVGFEEVWPWRSEYRGKPSGVRGVRSAAGSGRAGSSLGKRGALSGCAGSMA